nr:alpha-L-fucosidase [Paludisphaera mucosa]
MAARAQDLPKPLIAPGPFQPDMKSLEGYKCPEWFRDAKFGIWAHWGPQAVPGEGDWYARRMYEEGGASTPATSRSTGIPRSRATRTSSRSGRPRAGNPTA